MIERAFQRCIHLGPGAARLLSALCLYGCFESEPHGSSPDRERDGAVADGGAAGPTACGVVGRSVACVGPGGCAGGQICRPDGTFGPCDCGSAPRDAGGEPDAADDGGGAPGVEPPACGVGAACTRDEDCETGFSCVSELPIEIIASDLPDGADRLALTAFPGGVCSPLPLLNWDHSRACDPFAPEGRQGCGRCGNCSGINFAGGLLLVACLEPCVPSLTTSGCSRDGYSCDLTTHACMHGCSSDVECKIAKLDTDGDGLADTSSYDPESEGSCDPATLRCTRPGRAGAQAGDPCMFDDDCEADGFCYGADRTFAGNPYVDGYCSKDGCDNAGFECAGDGICAELRSWSSLRELGIACRKPCTHGAEAEALRLGSAGHGDTCRAGYMCLWNGVAGDASGHCMPGNYNDVAGPNLGAQCLGSSECYSPSGHGLCLTVEEGLSICSVMDCDAPGFDADICGEAGACVLLPDQRRTACMARCTDAGDCPAALGCALAEGLPTQSIGVCVPCVNDAECLAGQSCDRGRCG